MHDMMVENSNRDGKSLATMLRQQHKSGANENLIDAFSVYFSESLYDQTSGSRFNLLQHRVRNSKLYDEDFHIRKGIRVVMPSAWSD
jgi:hypothetical protein